MVQPELFARASKRVTRFGALGTAIILSAALTGCASSAAGDNENVTMRINTGVGPSHHLVENVFEPWKEEVESATDGRVKVEIHNSGTLGSLETALTDLSNQVYDVGTVVPNYFMDSGAFPLTISSLAFAYPDIETGNKVLAEFTSEFKEDINVEGVRFVDTSVSDPYAVFSQTPIRTVEDIQGKQFKVQSASDAGVVEQWGGNPVQMPTGETYQALERGTIDGAPYTIVGNTALGLHEVASNVTLLNAWGTMSTPSVSEGFMNTLPDDLVAQFEEELLPALAELNQGTYLAAYEEALENLEADLEASGGEIIEVASSDLAGFQNAAEGQWTEWIEQADRLGYDGEAMVDAWLDLLEDEGAETPELGDL